MFRIIKWLIALPIGIFIFFNAYVYGNIITYRAVAPHQTAFMSMRMKQFEQEGRDVALDYRWVPYNRISVNLKKALIASEDAHFAGHGGFDWGGIQNAIRRNRNSGEVKAGGSTISQQLAKNLFLNESRSYIRKGEEAAITAMMEAVTDKDRIFELYLNSIEWHYGVFGAEAASRYFYKIPAAKLTKQQAAKLTARVPAPLYYADHPKSKRLRNKTNIVLKRMGSAELPEDDTD
ncbi:monofunctional biosynthetic peptidoglycan transglycosylase [Neisseria bergeri]|uniref:monofunctional biosynthetic peptidoglycan transglycosylase n=1 Tax=Neisseria bergeri TaxID=1906581 RepID=UPI00272D0629|nr:monofunctional biosynthetic peptidoglycan transglycosylase [Neisseria bergeri]